MPKLRKIIAFLSRAVTSAAVACALLNTTPTFPFADAQSRYSPGAEPDVVAIDQVLQQNGIPVASQMVSNWPQITSKSAVVMDLNSGTVIYEKAPLEPHYPASITKILTAKIALDRGHLTDLLKTSRLATEQGGNRVYLVPGEVEPLEKLLYGLLLNSGNDAAVVIAEHYGGSVQHFADMMNEEAARLGATHSHFDNPNGLPDSRHVTTAYDMALIARAAMQNPEFRKIVKTKWYQWKGQAWTSTLVNSNRLLFDYSGAIGVKTGYTTVAHETLVVAATRGTDSFLAVLMDAPLRSEIQADARHLLDFAFAHYHTQTVVQKGEVVANVRSPQGTLVPLRSAQTVYATEPKGRELAIQTRLEPITWWHSLPPDAVVGYMLVSGNRELLSVPLYSSVPIAVPAVHQTPARNVVILLVLGVCVVVLSGFVTRFLVIRRYRISQ
jgi:serine-type D-Ala-D-Ala carboxypeptidase (penicillin-binding protein 5/6)